MIEYIEGTKSIISLLPNIKKMFNNKNRKKIEMWGSYETFESYNREYHGDLQILELICDKPKYNYDDYKKKGIRFYLVGEIGYWKLIKRYWRCYMFYLMNRPDLNILDRIKLAYSKSKRWISKWQFRYEINKYFKRKESFNKEFKRKFNNGEIDIIYLYMYETKKELK